MQFERVELKYKKMLNLKEFRKGKNRDHMLKWKAEISCIREIRYK